MFGEKNPVEENMKNLHLNVTLFILKKINF